MGLGQHRLENTILEDIFLGAHNDERRQQTTVGFEPGFSTEAPPSAAAANLSDTSQEYDLNLRLNYPIVIINMLFLNLGILYLFRCFC